MQSFPRRSVPVTQMYVHISVSWRYANGKSYSIMYELYKVCVYVFNKLTHICIGIKPTNVHILTLLTFLSFKLVNKIGLIYVLKKASLLKAICRKHIYELTNKRR